MVIAVSGSFPVVCRGIVWVTSAIARPERRVMKRIRLAVDGRMFAGCYATDWFGCIYCDEWVQPQIKIFGERITNGSWRLRLSLVGSLAFMKSSVYFRESVWVVVLYSAALNAIVKKVTPLCRPLEYRYGSPSTPNDLQGRRS